MYILIVEDDYLQADWLSKALKSAFANSEIARVGTEFEFRSRLDEIAKRSPDVIIMDIMLPWSDPSEDIPLPPEDVQEGQFYRAGLRCEKLLAERDDTKEIPVILYSVLERTDLANELPTLPSNVEHLSKQSDPWPLIDKIRVIMR